MNMLLVPPSLYERARRVLGAKLVKSCGSYVRHEFEGRLLNWERESTLRGSGGCFPRTDGYFETYYFPTKAMKKRGYKMQKRYWWHNGKKSQ